MRVLTAVLTICASTGLADHELEGRDIAAGQLLYAGNCASCHGAQLEGQPDWQRPGDDGVLPAPPHNAEGHTWHHDNALLFTYTKSGGKGALAQMGIHDFNSGMPAFENTISDSDIWDILAYIRSTWPERQQAAQAGRNPPHQQRTKRVVISTNIEIYAVANAFLHPATACRLSFD